MQKFLFEPARRSEPPWQLAPLSEIILNLLTQTSSRVKMGFNYLLMERKFNFLSQSASDFCTKQKFVEGWGWEQKVLCNNVSNVIERGKMRGERSAAARDQRTLCWADWLRPPSCFTIIAQEWTREHRTLGIGAGCSTARCWQSRRKLINDLIPQFQTRCFSPSLTSSHFPAALFPPVCVIIHYMYFLHYSLFPFECVINIPDSHNLRQRKTWAKGPKINKHSRYSPVDCNSCGQGLIVRDLYMSVYQGLLSQNVECPLCTWSHCFNIVSLPCWHVGLQEARHFTQSGRSRTV